MNELDLVSITQGHVVWAWKHLVASRTEETALFGAGQHTQWLLDALRSGAMPYPALILDDNTTAKHIDGISVMTSAEAKMRGLKISTVILSSDILRTRSLFRHRIEKSFPDAEIIDLYDGMPDGPYPKKLEQLPAVIAAPVVKLDEIERKLFNLFPNFLNYWTSDASQKSSFYKCDREADNTLAAQLTTLGIPLETREIDIAGFECWIQGSFKNLHRHYKFPVAIEKSLEHYLTFSLLGIERGDRVIDIAASGSPFTDALNAAGYDAYNLDLVYPAGIHARRIGADAGNTNLPDGFATCLTLHCAYECLMGDSDTKFIIEASRILRDGGRLGVIPLYLTETHINKTSPLCPQDGLLFDPGAKKVWRDDQWKAPFSRNYSPLAFHERVFSCLPKELHGKVIRFTNLEEVRQRFHDKNVYTRFMFVAEKKGF